MGLSPGPWCCQKDSQEHTHAQTCKHTRQSPDLWSALSWWLHSAGIFLCACLSLRWILAACTESVVWPMYFRMKEHQKYFPPFLPSPGPSDCHFKEEKKIYFHSPVFFSYLPSLLPSSESLQPRINMGQPESPHPQGPLFCGQRDCSAGAGPPKCGSWVLTPFSAPKLESACSPVLQDVHPS